MNRKIRKGAPDPGETGARSPATQLRISFSNNLFFSLMVMPALSVMLFLTLYPVLNTLHTSLYRYNYFSDSKSFLGLANYARIAADRLFRVSFLNTVKYSFIATGVETTLGILLALLLQGHFPAKRLILVAYVFPMMISTMVICAVWRALFHFDIGLLNYLLKLLNLEPVGWLINRRIALLSVIVVDVWQWTPFCFLIIHAGLTTIPREILEAASMDGAGPLQTSFRILLPLVGGQVLLVFLLRTIDTFRIFAKVYALTQGGPGNATETVSYYIYREGFVHFNLGRSSTASVYVLLFIAAVSVFYLIRIFKD